MNSMRGCLYRCYRDGIQGFAEFWRTTALASRVSVACPQRKHSAQDYLSFAKTPQDHKSRPRHDVTRLSTCSNSSEKPVGTWGFFGKMHEASAIYGAGNGNRVNLAPLIRARSVVQVHPGPPFKSPINTRRFSLFPFSGRPLKKPFCQPFVNFTIGRMALHTGR